MRAFGSYRQVVLLASLSVCNVSMADNFGLVMGMASHELNTVKDDDAPLGILRLLDVPTSSDSYATYLGQFSDEQGLCWIKAIGVEMDSDPTGVEARAGFVVEKMRLTKIFGQAKEFDFRFQGQVDDDLDTWLRAVSEGDRYVAAIWERTDGVALPSNLDSVGLVLNASTSRIAYISLEYTFNNIALCEQEIKLKN